MTHNPFVIPAPEPESRWRIKSAMTIVLNVIPGHDPADSTWQFTA